MKPLRGFLRNSSDYGLQAFTLLLKNRRLFVLRELSIYLMFLGVNSMAVFTTLFTGNFNGLLGALGGLGVIGILMVFKLKSLWSMSTRIFTCLSLEDEEEKKQRMIRDLEYFDMLFRKKYGKEIRLSIEGE